MNKKGQGSPSSAQLAKRRRVLKARLTLLLILIILAGGIWLLVSVLTQIKTVTELTVDASGYTVLQALPSQSEYEDQKRQEELDLIKDLLSSMTKSSSIVSN